MRFGCDKPGGRPLSPTTAREIQAHDKDAVCTVKSKATGRDLMYRRKGKAEKVEHEQRLGKHEERLKRQEEKHGKAKEGTKGKAALAGRIERGKKRVAELREKIKGMGEKKGPSVYQEKKQARIERLKKARDKAKDDAQAHWDKSEAILSHIPMGQPILVGHHSEKRHRRDLDKADNHMRGMSEALKKEKQLESAIDAAEKNKSISSDDPEAVPALQKKLQKMEADRDRNTQINKMVRKQDKDGLKNMGLSDKTIESLFTPMYGRIGIPAYVNQNLSGNIARVKKRIEELSNRESAPIFEKDNGHGVTAKEDREDNRIKIYFPGKPSPEIIKELKSSGFHWSPGNQAWQRQTSNQAKYHADRIMKKAFETKETSWNT